MLSDSSFTTQTGAIFPPGSAGAEKMEENLKDNNDPLNPSFLFANARK
jgi:hypothetical protein